MVYYYSEMTGIAQYTQRLTEIILKMSKRIDELENKINQIENKSCKCHEKKDVPVENSQSVQENTIGLIYYIRV